MYASASRSLLLLLKFTEIHQLTTGGMGKDRQKINKDTANHEKSSMPWNIVGISILYMTVEQEYEGAHKHNFYQIRHGD
jgi:hypothetical protein